MSEAMERTAGNWRPTTTIPAANHQALYYFPAVYRNGRMHMSAMFKVGRFNEFLVRVPTLYSEIPAVPEEARSVLSDLQEDSSTASKAEGA